MANGDSPLRPNCAYFRCELVSAGREEALLHTAPTEPPKPASGPSQGTDATGSAVTRCDDSAESPTWPDGSPKTPDAIAAEVTGHTYGCNCLRCDGARAASSATTNREALMSEICNYIPVDPAALDAAAYALHRDGYEEGDYIPEEADPEDFERAEVVLQGLRAAGFDVVRRA